MAALQRFGTQKKQDEILILSYVDIDPVNRKINIMSNITFTYLSLCI